ncbi:MAG: hypothetical protein ACX930_01285 [Erythrobacter sp.]
MLHVTPKELARLGHCLTSLETVLQTLDELGAGIAAIHVDAAIDQLRGNIEVARAPANPDRRGSGSCPSEQPVISR